MNPPCHLRGQPDRRDSHAVRLTNRTAERATIGHKLIALVCSCLRPWKFGRIAGPTSTSNWGLALSYFRPPWGSKTPKTEACTLTFAFGCLPLAYLATYLPNNLFNFFSFPRRPAYVVWCFPWARKSNFRAHQHTLTFAIAVFDHRLG